MWLPRSKIRKLIIMGELIKLRNNTAAELPGSLATLNQSNMFQDLKIVCQVCQPLWLQATTWTLYVTMRIYGRLFNWPKPYNSMPVTKLNATSMTCWSMPTSLDVFLLICFTPKLEDAIQLSMCPPVSLKKIFPHYKLGPYPSIMGSSAGPNKG